MYTNLEMESNLKEVESMVFIREIFIPELRDFFREKSPEKFRMWSENACRQVAMFSKIILDVALPDYTWVVKDQYFIGSTVSNNKYNHAYVIGTNKKTGKHILVDLEREPLSHDIFAFIDDINSPYKGIESYENMRFIEDIDDIDFYKFRKIILQDREFYTGMLTLDIIETVFKRIRVKSGNDKEISKYMRKILNKAKITYK